MINQILWEMVFGTAIANWDKDSDVFTGTQFENAELGEEYHVVFNPIDGSARIDPKSTGTTTMGQILLRNNTLPPNAKDLALGFTIHGNLAGCQETVHPNQAIVFEPPPTYQIACCGDIKLGQLVDSAEVLLGRIQFTFPDGATEMTVKAYMDGKEYKLEAYIN